MNFCMNYRTGAGKMLRETLVVFSGIHAEIISKLSASNNNSEMDTEEWRGTEKLHTEILVNHVWACRTSVQLFFSASAKPTRICTARFSRAKSHRSNIPKFVASHLCKTSHTGTDAPKFVPSRRGWLSFDLLKRGSANSGEFGAHTGENYLDIVNFCNCMGLTELTFLGA